MYPYQQEQQLKDSVSTLTNIEIFAKNNSKIVLQRDWMTEEYDKSKSKLTLAKSTGLFIFPLRLLKEEKFMYMSSNETFFLDKIH